MKSMNEIPTKIEKIDEEAILPLLRMSPVDIFVTKTKRLMRMRYGQ